MILGDQGESAGQPGPQRSEGSGPATPGQGRGQRQDAQQAGQHIQHQVQHRWRILGVVIMP